MAVKILAVSDNVLPQMQDADYLRRTFSDIALLISCGDMPASYLDVIGSVLNVPLFFVRGNHDTRYVPPEPGGDNMHLKFKTLKGMTFVGLEGSINYNQGAIQYTEQEMFAKVLRLMPRLLAARAQQGYGIDVVIAHSPPRGIHDIPDDYAHRGFKAFLYLMKWGQPRYLLHGHVDTWDNRKPRQTVFEKTTVININPYMLLELQTLA